MELTAKEQLQARLNECITQLKQAEKALRKDAFMHASIYLDNVQNQLPVMQQQLAKH